MRIPDGIYWAQVNGSDWVMLEFRGDQLIADFSSGFLDGIWDTFDWRAAIRSASIAAGDDLAAEILARARPNYIDAEVRVQCPGLN
jgi:hypothetical protein